MFEKRFLPVVLLVLIYSINVAQDYPREFGFISKEEIDLKEYKPDKDAEAVVLYDKAKSYFLRISDGYELVFERSTRIKVFSEAGLKWAKVEIPFYREGEVYEKVYDIEAYSYNFENGRLIKTPININNTYTEKLSNSWLVKKFVVSNVKPGSIIEYKYKVSTQYMFNLRDWEFQWKIPVIYSEYEVSMIPFYVYRYLLQGANNFDYYNSYESKDIKRQFGAIKFKDLVHVYAMKDVPAFRSEDFITSINDYIIKLDFQLAKINYPTGGSKDIMTTWDIMIEEMLSYKDFGKYIQKSEKIANKLFLNEKSGFISEKNKFNYVLDYVKDNYNWNDYNSRYASKSPKKFLEEKLGNCADINLFTIGALRAIGIDAKPVLISTRNHGKIQYDYPFTSFFNYVVVLAKIDGKNVLADATEVLSLNNRIPSRCINDMGLVVQEDKVEWISLNSRNSSNITTFMQMQVEGNNLTVDLAKSSTEYDALDYRNSYGDKINKVKKELAKSNYCLVDSSVLIRNFLKKDQPYKLQYRFSTPVEMINDKIYISPFLDEIISENPLKQKSRKYPVDLVYPVKRVFNTSIAIPKGYNVEYLPLSQKISNTHFDLNYFVMQKPNEVIITFNYYFKKSVYSSKEYSKVKFYFNEIVKKGNDKIVFSKAMEGNT